MGVSADEFARLFGSLDAAARTRFVADLWECRGDGGLTRLVRAVPDARDTGIDRRERFLDPDGAPWNQ